MLIFIDGYSEHGIVREFSFWLNINHVVTLNNENTSMYYLALSDGRAFYINEKHANKIIDSLGIVGE